MPAYNFQHRFAGSVVKGLMKPAWEKGGEALSMEHRLWDLATRFNVDQTTLPKRQTIRLCRKRPTKPGDTLYLYTGLRTKSCIKLGQVECKDVYRVRLFRVKEKLWLSYPDSPYWISREGVGLLDYWAQQDGFQTVAEMIGWFEKTHGLPFTGELITW